MTCAAWYPIDTGLFVTGSFDKDVKVQPLHAAPLKHLTAACSHTPPLSQEAVFFANLTWMLPGMQS